MPNLNFDQKNAEKIKKNPETLNLLPRPENAET